MPLIASTTPSPLSHAPLQQPHASPVAAVVQLSPSSDYSYASQQIELVTPPATTTHYDGETAMERVEEAPHCSNEASLGFFEDLHLHMSSWRNVLKYSDLSLEVKSSVTSYCCELWRDFSSLVGLNSTH